MKSKISFLVAIISITLLSGCSKTDVSTPEPEIVPTTTSLELTILDDSGNPMQGAEVRLYSSKEDMENELNQVSSIQQSGSDGKVVFTELASKRYYWFAEKGCENNSCSAFTTDCFIGSDTINSVNVLISGTGNLELISTSDNPYKVYVNGIQVFDMNGGSSRDIKYMPTGSYSIKVMQISGYLTYPTEETYDIVLDCGKSVEIIFPQSKRADS